MNTKILAGLIFLLLALRAESQDYKFVYYLDKDLNSVSKQKAVIVGKAYEQGGNLLLNCFLKSTGKLIITAGIKDSALSALHGLFKTYHNDMTTESEGTYAENEMEGVWKYWDKSGYLTDSMIYRHGTRIAYGSYQYSFSKPTIMQLLADPMAIDILEWYNYSFTDSLKNTFTAKDVDVKDGNEKIRFQADFVGNRGLLKEFDSTGAVKTDSVFTREQKEAEFPGGQEGWVNFLRKNMKAGVAADNLAPAGKYKVILKFVVNKDGTLSDIMAENDPGYGTAAEGIRVLKLSPTWKPAILYGIYRRAYRRQPLTFVVEN
jgi:antitoxin component YwqK of YwqJK toxin-antitoxin module